MPSLPKTGDAAGALAEAEMLQAMRDTLFRFAMRLEPNAQARLFAFVSLSESPEKVRAELIDAPDGSARLLLIRDPEAWLV
jgi:hypothetical protein